MFVCADIAGRGGGMVAFVCVDADGTAFVDLAVGDGIIDFLTDEVRAINPEANNDVAKGTNSSSELLDDVEEVDMVTVQLPIQPTRV